MALYLDCTEIMFLNVIKFTVFQQCHMHDPLWFRMQYVELGESWKLSNPVFLSTSYGAFIKIGGQEKGKQRGFSLLDIQTPLTQPKYKTVHGDQCDPVQVSYTELLVNTLFFLLPPTLYILITVSLSPCLSRSTAFLFPFRKSTARDINRTQLHKVQ